MLELIRRRHLSPIYGDSLIVPESHDWMVMDAEPDIVHMGHVHKNGYMMYRGTLLINSGTGTATIEAIQAGISGN